MTDLFRDVAEDDRRVGVGLWARRSFIVLFACVAAAALWGVLGQRAKESSASGPAVRMTLSAPEAVRGGLFFQSRVEIRALDAVEFPRLMLDTGWMEGMQVNSIEPAAESETSRDGRVVLSYGALAPGDLLRIWLQFQVEPTNIGRHPYGIELDDRTRRLARIERTLTVLP